MKKIYFNNKPLFLVNTINAEVEEYLDRPDTVFIDTYNISEVEAMVRQMGSPEINAGIFLHHDVDILLNAFTKYLQLMLAAGGLVYTAEHDLLLIFRRGKWDLPKGKLDEGEDLETCATREVTEETGLNNIQLEKELAVTWHTYFQEEKHIIKESHWFLMRSNRQQLLLPQIEEDIEKCEWVAVDQLASYMENTHPSIIDVIKAGIKALHEMKNV